MLRKNLDINKTVIDTIFKGQVTHSDLFVNSIGDLKITSKLKIYCRFYNGSPMFQASSFQKE